MAQSSESEEFVQALIKCQNRLYAYILAILADPNAADDVLQETNIVLWRKVEEFTPGTDFAAWAMRVALFQCQAYRQRQGRERLQFGDEFVQTLADRVQGQLEKIDDRLGLLRRCLTELTAHQRELLDLRYGPEGSVQQIAERLGRPAGSISQTLYRVRALLLTCIERRASGGEA